MKSSGPRTVIHRPSHAASAIQASMTNGEAAGTPIHSFTDVPSFRTSDDRIHPRHRRFVLRPLSFARRNAVKDRTSRQHPGRAAGRSRRRHVYRLSSSARALSGAATVIGRIEPGDIHQPVGSGSCGHGVADAVSQANELKLKTSPHQTGPGQSMHRSSYFFEPLTNSDVCVSCHQVAVHPGIWLEVVHAQYRAGPAAAKGITCQQCHMGAVPGKPSGYEWGHIAEINNQPFGQPQQKSNHSFWGPGYSIAHPAFFQSIRMRRATHRDNGWHSTIVPAGAPMHLKTRCNRECIFRILGTRQTTDETVGG